MKKENVGKKEKLVCALCGSDGLTFSGTIVYTTDNEEDFGDDIWFCQNCSHPSDFITEREFKMDIVCHDLVDIVTRSFITAERITTYDEAFHEGNYAFSEGENFASCTLGDEQLKNAWEEGWLYQEVYKEGEIAFHSGLDFQDCPYREEQPIEAWNYGWINETI